MKKPLSQIVPFETADGSYTLFDEARGVHYRSHHGAVTESRHVFLGATGLLERAGEWIVAELGFGAAVNFTQTVRAFRERPYVERLTYHTVDWRPVTPDHLPFHDGEPGDLARQALELAGEATAPVRVSSQDAAIDLILYPTPWENADLQVDDAQAFFHDPFARNVNPEAWTAETFRWARAALRDDGRLATYSAATPVRRAMFEAGLHVATAPGPGRKREITVAAPTAEALDPFELLPRQKYLPT